MTPARDFSDLPIVTLRRDATGEFGTFGVLAVPALGDKTTALVLQTAEEEWKDNQRRHSCIPHGDYLMRRTIYFRHNIETFEVTDVPQRSRILFHVGNTEEDTDGCILPGLARRKLWVVDEDFPGIVKPHVWKPGVVNSRQAFDRFMDWLAPVDEAMLQVRWIPGLP